MRGMKNALIGNTYEAYKSGASVVDLPSPRAVDANDWKEKMIENEN